MTESLPAPRLAEAYEVSEVVRRGGLSTTYRARHRGSGDLRCIDVLRPAPGELEVLERRLDADARPLMELRHPHVARLVDAAVGEGGRACLVREDHEGVTLRRLTGSHLPSVSLAVDLLRQATSALAFLREQGRKVGDLSPEGLLVGPGPDGAARLVVADLGLAKDWQEEAALTAAGLFVGRLKYAAPEQFEAAGRRGAPGDVYALGLIAYELLTGRHPIAGDSASSLIAGHLFRPPVDFAESDPEGRVPDQVRQLVLSALAKDPAERPTAASLHGELLQLQTTLPAVDPSELGRWVDSRGTVSPAVPAAELLDGWRPSDGLQLDVLMEEAHALARDEAFLAAREKVRQVLKVQPDHSMGLMLLASLEACLKIQVEESKAHQTLAVGPPVAETVRLPTLAASESPPETLSDSGVLNSGTETVRVTAEELRKMAGDAAGDATTQRLESVSQFPGGPASTERLDLGQDPSTVFKADLDDDKTRPMTPELLRRVNQAEEALPDLASLAHGTTQLLSPRSADELPGTVTLPMEQIEEGRRRALAAAPPSDDRPKDAVADAPPPEPVRKPDPGLTVDATLPALSTLPAIQTQPSEPPRSQTPPPLPKSSAPAGPAGPSARPALEPGHPSSFADPDPTPASVPEATPPPLPSRGTSGPQVSQSGEPAKASASVHEMGFGGAPTAGYAERASRGRSRRSGKNRGGRRGKQERRSSGGTLVMVGAVLAAILVFGIGYAVAAGVDLRGLLGLGESQPVVTPAEMPPVAAEPGWLLLDAAPWAEILQITDSVGEEVPLRFRHTPARYELPPGTYAVVVASPDGENQTLEVEVTSDQSTKLRPEFAELSVDEYFRLMGWR